MSRGKRTTDGKEYQWEEAKRYCLGLALAGDGWRLPTRAELELLVEKGKRPTIDQIAFPDTPRKFFWTSRGRSPLAWYVEFFDGISNFNVITNSYRVRCVR